MADPAARTPFEVLTTYPGLHAVMHHRVTHRLWTRGWRFSARWLAFLSRCITNVDIHPAARIGSGLFIDHGAGVVIGETARIDDGVTLYHGVTLGGTTWHRGQRHPSLGPDVIVGAGAKVLGAISVGEGAKVGANAVVVETVPPFSTVVGVPGRVVRMRVAGQVQAARVDLDHHRIPDPVEARLRALAARLDRLESGVPTAFTAERLRQPSPLDGQAPSNSRMLSPSGGA